MQVAWQCQRETKTYRLGTLLTFDTKEFNDFCWTFCHFAIAVSKALEQYGRAKGVPFFDRTTGECK